MKVCQFNFNNEVDTFTIHVEEDGRVTVPGENEQILAEYDNVQQLAEIYAQARDVKPENLKNWVLLENGNVFSFVLRAGTAGVNVSDVEEQLEQAFTSLNERFHALSIARAKEQIMADGTADLTDVLVHCTETEIANAVYDVMEAIINGTADTSETAPAEEDTRTDLEKYVDEMEEVPGAITFLASLVGLTADVEKTALVEALGNSYALSNVNSLRELFRNAVNDTINEGIGVNNVADALTVITQTVAGVKDNAVKDRMTVAARMAGRDKVNVSVDIVGSKHIRHTTEMVSLVELTGVDLFVRENVPYIVRFSDTIDDELEAERDAAAEREAREAEDGNGSLTILPVFLSRDDDEDDYDGDYDDDDNEDEEEY